jgi:hypothetical protein
MFYRPKFHFLVQLYRSNLLLINKQQSPEGSYIFTYLLFQVINLILMHYFISN